MQCVMARGRLSRGLAASPSRALLGRKPAKFDVIVRPETLAETAYDRLAASLMDGALIPGDRVASRNLAADLGISATPAREAMLRLVGEGALEMVNARTIVVPELSSARLNEIYLVRLSLEPKCAAAAAKRLTDADLRGLERTQQRMINAYATRDYRAVFR